MPGVRPPPGSGTQRLLADGVGANEIAGRRNLPKPTVQALRLDGHDVLWARTDCHSEHDSFLLEIAESEGRIVLTLDKDFWQIALQRRQPLLRAGVVLVRVHPAVPDAVTSLVRRALATGRRWIGHVSVVSVEGIEMFPSHG